MRHSFISVSSPWHFKIFAVSSLSWTSNSLVPGRWDSTFETIIFKLIIWNSSLGLCCEIALRLMPLNLTNENLTWVQVMAWCRQETSHYLNQWWPRSPTSYGITRLHWVNSLRPSDAIWQHGAGSTLVHVMACYLTAPSHYLNQCWLIISKA